MAQWRTSCVCSNLQFVTRACNGAKDIEKLILHDSNQHVLIISISLEFHKDSCILSLSNVIYNKKNHLYLTLKMFVFRNNIFTIITITLRYNFTVLIVVSVLLLLLYFSADNYSRHNILIGYLICT